jgi:hypothetical protein
MLSSSFVVALRSAAVVTFAASLAVACSTEEEVAPLERWPSGLCSICPVDETQACADGNVCSDNPSCCGRGLYCSNGEWFEEYGHSCRYGDSDASDADFSDSSATAECPAGPEAPLDLPCEQEGLQCAYGYEPPECGGRTVICQGGVWIEESQSDPQPACLDAGQAPD